MGIESGDKFSAGPQGLGYIYQPKLALYKLLELPESTGVFIEGQDDLEFTGDAGDRSLASLKHKAVGDTLTSLSPDFWKSVRIWLERYKSNNNSLCNLQFFLYTTSSVSENSFLKYFLIDTNENSVSLLENFEEAMTKSSTTLMSEIAHEFHSLVESEQADFVDRISIFDSTPRITDLSTLISDKHLRTIRRENRQSVLERLEGWWQDITIKQLAGEKVDPIYGYEVSDKLSSISEEYQSNSLPITFRGKQPAGKIDPETDNRMFVQQLRILGVSSSRMQSAIIDYYRAFEQRSSWARENLLVPDEMEEYEDRLVEEWQRYRDLILESAEEDQPEEKLITAGREILRWAERETEHLRIRERVTELYVVRGAFQLLANYQPHPRVHWHPEFLERIERTLEIAS